MWIGCESFIQLDGKNGWNHKLSLSQTDGARKQLLSAWKQIQTESFIF